MNHLADWALGSTVGLLGAGWLLALSGPDFGYAAILAFALALVFLLLAYAGRGPTPRG